VTPTIDPKSALAASASFLRGHELLALARELPASIDLPPEQRDRFEKALAEGFDSAFVFPSTAVQKVHFEAMVKQLAGAPAFGLPKSEQYEAPWVPDLWALKTSPARNRPMGPYILLYRTTSFPRETRDRSAPDLDRLFAPKDWNGLAVPEYLVIQRILVEKNGNHRFDIYIADATRSQWQWLLDSRLPSGVVMAFWNPKKCRVEISVAPEAVNSARRGAHPTVVIPVG